MSTSKHIKTAKNQPKKWINDGPKVVVVTCLVALHIRQDYVQKRKHLGFYEHDLMDQEHSSTKWP